MSRSRGSKNANYEETRSRLLKAIRARLLQTGSDKVSFREMADGVAVAVPTLRHYFVNRTAVIQEVLADLHRDGLRYIDEMSKTDLDLDRSLQQAANAIVAGVRLGRLDKVHTLGLTEGLGHQHIGPSYLHSILEPALQALERRFETHVSRGEMSAESTRHAALAFASPLILAALHQFGLGGDCARPLDLDEFARNHAAAFARAYRPTKNEGDQKQ